MPCTNPDCLYLHEFGSQEDSFTKDEIISEYTRGRVQQVTGITNDIQRRSGNFLPPAADDYSNNTTSSWAKPISKTPTNDTTNSMKVSPPNSSSGRSVALPAAASWGTHASNSQPLAANAVSSNGTLKQKVDTCTSTTTTTTTTTATLSFSTAVVSPSSHSNGILKNHSEESKLQHHHPESATSTINSHLCTAAPNDKNDSMQSSETAPDKDKDVVSDEGIQKLSSLSIGRNHGLGLQPCEDEKLVQVQPFTSNKPKKGTNTNLNPNPNPNPTMDNKRQVFCLEPEPEPDFQNNVEEEEEEEEDLNVVDPTEHQKVHGNDLHQMVARWQVPKSQKGGRNGFYGSKREQTHNKHREQRANVVNTSKIWTKKPKPENGGVEVVKSRVQNDATSQSQSQSQSNCSQLMIGSISVTVRSPGQGQENGNTEVKKNNVQAGRERSTVKIWRPRHESRGVSGDSKVKGENGQSQTPPTCQSNDDSDGGNEPEAKLFSLDAAKAFLAQRWKEAISGEHSKLILSLSSSREEPPGENSESSSNNNMNNNNTSINNTNNVKVKVKGKFVMKGEKGGGGVKTKYIPKQKGGVN